MILAIDIGGTAVKLALADANGGLTALREAPVAFDGYRTPIIDTVIAAAQALLKETGASVRGVGVSATGQIDAETGVVIGTNGQIPRYEGTPIRKAMEEAFGVPARALNDANAAALGECFAGRAKGLRHVVMATYGTGVGGGVVVDGKLLLGARGIAGEIGLMPTFGSGPEGRYESRAATSALVRAARQAAGEPTLDGRTVFDRLSAGDETLQPVVDRWLDDVATGLVGLVHTFDPQMIVLGGGVSAQEERFIAPVRARVLQGALPRFAEGLQVEAAALGNRAGLIGAAKYFMDTAL